MGVIENTRVIKTAMFGRDEVKVELKPDQTNFDSVYAIMNNISVIDGNLQKKVTFDQIERTLMTYSTINVYARLTKTTLIESQINYIISEIRSLDDTWISSVDDSSMTAEQALIWLTLRICINNDIADFLRSQSELNHHKQKTADQRQVKIIHISLLWHCASIRSFNIESFELQFDEFYSARFKGIKKIPKLVVIYSLKEFLNRIYPHISSSVNIFKLVFY